MARRKAKGARTKSGALSRALSAILDRNPPPTHILERRALFSFGDATKGGNIDQDVCDGIGQMHRLGLLEGWGTDSLAMRNAGREYAELWWSRYGATAAKCGSYERADRSSNPYDGETSRDRRFNRMDAAIIRSDKHILLSLCEPSDTIVPWAQALIHEALLERRKLVKFMCFPTCEDRARLEALCRGLVALVEGESVRRNLAA